MKNHITTILFFAILLSISLAACTETKDNQESQEGIQENQSIQEETPAIDQDTNKVASTTEAPAEFIQESDGLEYAVMELYLKKYLSGELTSVRDGMSQTMKPKEHLVHLDPTLLSGNDMGFFLGKNPEFLVKPDKAVTAIDNTLVSNKRISLKGFERTKGLDFLKNKENYNNGDLLLMVSRTFYFKGAYFVHVWEFSTAKSIYHYRRLTFKFDAEQKLIDQGFINHYQKGYSGAAQFLKNIDKSIELPEDAELQF